MTRRAPMRRASTAKKTAAPKRRAPAPAKLKAPEKGQPGRPRKRAGEADMDRRYAEAHRLETIRDEAAAAAQGSTRIADKVAWLAAEQQVAAAWASALRADGKIPLALKYTDAAVKLAGAHAKAIEQLSVDRVDELYRVMVRRRDAADELERELAARKAEAA